MGARRLKVLSLCSTFPNPLEPGLGPFSRAVLQALADTDEVKVIAPVAPFDYDNPNRNGFGRRSVPLARIDGELEVLHPPWIYFPRNWGVNGVFMALSLIWRIWRLRREFRFDLIDAHFAHPEGVAGWLLAWAFGCPYLIRLNGNELVNARHWLRRALMTRALRGAARLVAVSHELRDLAISLGADPGKAVVVANGVDVTLYNPRDRTQARVALQLDQSRRVLLTAGRLIEAKGFQHVIRAVGQLRQRGMQVELAIAGGPSRGLPNYKRELQDLVAALSLEDAVRFLDWIPPERMAMWQSAADVFCLASHREGCPNVVIEALACGTPVVATDVGMVRKLVPSDRYGLLVQTADAQPLAAALERALEQPWDRAAIAAWGQSRSWTDAAREIREQLFAAAGQPSPSAEHSSPCASR